MAKPKFYAVKVGRHTGIYSTWAECEAQVKGSPGSKYKSFTSPEEAHTWMAGNESAKPANSPSRPAAQGDSESKGRKRKISDVQDESVWDVVYSDGASKRNGHPDAVAGVGVWWGRDDPRNIAERCPGIQTNNRAELIAILRILETAPQSKRPLLIKTDSQYCKNCFQDWLPNWVKNNFKSSTGQPVKNAALIKYLSAQLDARARHGQKVRLQHVKAHNGEEGNEGADAQANLGVYKPREEERDWARLEAELKDRLEAEFAASPDRPQPALLEVEDEEGTVAVRNLGENPAKMRKTSAVVTEKSKSRLKMEPEPLSYRASPGPVPPKSSLTPEDLAEYADCMLDDDLLAELSD
ncbi:ribonuclease H-like domain-containing protein [Mycena latifolia]|nr:ribonuclease H-like domain-containing protein [Mycena latifolia]